MYDAGDDDEDEEDEDFKHHFYFADTLLQTEMINPDELADENEDEDEDEDVDIGGENNIADEKPPMEIKTKYYLNKSPQKSRKFSKTVICSCGRKFSYENLYAYHKRWECGQELTCRFCQRAYCSVYYVKRHMKKCKKNGKN